MREQVARLEGLLREREKGVGRTIRNDLEKPMKEWGEGELRKARNKNEAKVLGECERKLMEVLELEGEEEKNEKVEGVLRVVRGRVDLLYDAEEVGWAKACRWRGLKNEGKGEEVVCFRCGEKGHVANRCRAKGEKGRKRERWESEESDSEEEERRRRKREERKERRRKEMEESSSGKEREGRRTKGKGRKGESGMSSSEGERRKARRKGESSSSEEERGRKVKKGKEGEGRQKKRE